MSKVKLKSASKRSRSSKLKSKTVKKKNLNRSIDGSNTSRILNSALTSGHLCREIQKGVDDALMRLSPKVQGQIDQVFKTLDKTSFNLYDLRTLGYKVLKQAMEVTETIKVVPILANPVGSLLSKKRKATPLKKQKKA